MQAGPIPIAVGEKVFIQFSGESGKIKSEVVGFSDDNFILVRFPAIPGIRSKVSEGKTLIVKLFSDGAVYGFKADVINYVSKPEFLLFISYPAYIEKIEVRKHNRILCHMPTEVYINDFHLKGIIFDISKGGCRVNIFDITLSILKHFEVNEEVLLSFYVSTEKENINIVGQIKNITSSMEDVSVGLKFKDDDPAISRVHDYIDYVKSIYNPT